MAISLSSFLLILYISCETIRANYAYYAFHTFPQISASLVALFSEALKLLIASLFLLRAKDGFTLKGFSECVRSLQQGENLDLKRILKYALPAGLYLTNNLIYYTVLPQTSPSLLQVCVLAKLPTTGILHHFLIKPQRSIFAWTSLFFLCIGLVVFNLPSNSHASQEDGGPATSWLLAPVAGFVIACLSALASIATETSTKTGEFWESQAYLYIWGMIFAIIAYPLAPSGAATPTRNDPANSFDVSLAILGLVVMTSGTGLMVAIVLRARDNILKLIGTAASLLTIAASQFVLLPELRASTFTPWRVCGGGIVSISTWCYNHYSQTLWLEEDPDGEQDAEAEGLLNTDQLARQEKAEDGEAETEAEELVSMNILMPTPNKIVCCAVIVGFVTMEVALRQG